MLHKAAHSFSPFKLQHLHSHIRSALNLNLGQNAGQNFNQASTSTASSSSSASSSALGGPAAQAGGSAGNAKYHAGRSYSHYYFYNRTTTPAANAATGNDGTSIQKQLADEEEEAAGASSRVLAHTNRNLRWRTGRRFAGRQRSSSLSNPGLTTGLPLETSEESSNLPRSSPYSFNQAQLQARYRHAFSQAKRPSHERLLTLSPESTLSSQKRSIVTSSSSKAIPTAATTLSSDVSKTAPSSPRLRSRQISAQQTRRNSTSTTERPPTVSEDVINAASTLVEPAQKTISPEQPVNSEQASETTSAQSSSSASVTSPSQTQSPSRRLPSDAARFDTEVLPRGENRFTPEETAFQRELSQLAKYQELEQIRAVLRSYKASRSEWTSRKHSHAIKLLSNVKHFGGPMYNDIIIDLYNDFYELDSVPHVHTVGAVIQAYADRSQATLDLMDRQQLQNNAARLAPAASYWIDNAPFPLQNQEAASAEVDGMLSDSSLAALRQQSDEDYAAMKRCISVLGAELGRIHSDHLEAVLACAGRRGDIDTALIAFGAIETGYKHDFNRTSMTTMKNLILTYARGGDARGLFTVFETYLRGPRVQSKNRTSAYNQKKFALATSEENTAEGQEVSDDAAAAAAATAADGGADASAASAPVEAASQTGVHFDSEVDVCNAAIYGYLLVGEGVKALDVLESMMANTGANAYDKTPRPTDTTLLNLVKGFAESGDYDSAFRWANRIHATPTPEDLPTPPKLEDTLNTIIATTSDIGTLQEAAGKTPMLPQLGAHVRSLTSAGQSQETTAAQSENTPASPTTSTGNVTDLGSIFSDPSMRSRTLSITPPPYISHNAGSANTFKPDYRLSHTLDDMIRALRRGDSGSGTTQILDIIRTNAADGIYAHPETLARFLQVLGTTNDKPAVDEIYQMATQGLAALDNAADQAAAWAYLEDRMLIATAKKGELKQAAMHRDRLIAAGAAPSADAYAAMITSANDTTDDATVALELFEEARRFGVVPNLFLFNILISKLSKARRTQLALSYFEQMKAVGIAPSAVTYGSVIAACCRTGDEKAATYLFNEMVNSPHFRPRVPPYNTMMQFFITTKPDREKALSYFDAMLRAGVAPTGHTYKLLLDAYGSLEPVDLDSVKDVFSRLLEDPNVPLVTGGHWASLIHAYGTVQQDLDKTIEIFDSIARHPSSQRKDHALPDVICYEALFNALLAMKKIDLIEKYLARMQGQFVRPTAYIWNVIIRAYTVTGDIEKARSVFEALADPPSGVAAAGNHATEATKPEVAAPDAETGEYSDSLVNPGPIVYREPSTYEAMIKAEMSIGSPEKAQELLQRAVARAFPTAIISKLERMTKGEDVGAPAFAPSIVQPVA